MLGALGGEEQVTDFGVSATLQNSTSMCHSFVGTFKYMSPERMKSEQYSYSSDIWSLGLVLMECATNLYPYQVSLGDGHAGKGREGTRDATHL